LEKELEMLALKNRVWKDTPKSQLGQPIYSDLATEIRACHADELVLTYVRDIIVETRKDPSITVGASPRAGELLLYASKAKAILSGRDHVIPDDVKSMSRKVLPHRVMMNLENELEGQTTHMIVEKILNRVPVIQRPQKIVSKQAVKA
jgi:MoxR-like ATPase